MHVRNVFSLFMKFCDPPKGGGGSAPGLLSPSLCLYEGVVDGGRKSIAGSSLLYYYHIL